MNCWEITSYLPNYCENKLDKVLQQEIQSHLANCPPCQNEYRLILMETQAIKNGLRIPQLSPDFSSRIIDSVKSLDNNYSPQSAPSTEQKTNGFYRQIAGIAASLLLLITLIKAPGFFTGPYTFSVNNSSNHEEQTAYEPERISIYSAEADDLKSSKSRQLKNMAVSDGLVKSTGCGLDEIDYRPLPVLPEQYKLIKSDIDDTSGDLYYYANDKSTIILIQLSPVENQTIIKQSPQDFKEMDVCSLVKKFQLENRQYIAVISANLSIKELQELGNQIELIINN